MRMVFADSGYWVALLYPRDQHHATAKAVAAGLGQVSIVTTHMVLAEAFNAMAQLGEGGVAAMSPNCWKTLRTTLTSKSYRRLKRNSGLRWSGTPRGVTSRGASRTVRAFWSWRSVASPRRWLMTGTSSRRASSPC